jgi:hypothetical protein
VHKMWSLQRKVHLFRSKTFATIYLFKTKKKLHVHVNLKALKYKQCTKKFLYQGDLDRCIKTVHKNLKFKIVKYT